VLKLAPLAIFWAFSPLTCVIGIMFLSGERGLQKALFFVLPGVIVSITVGIVVLLTLHTKDFSQQAPATQRAHVGQLIVAFLFFAFAFLWWMMKARKGQEAKLPRWVQFMDSFKPSRVLLIGLYECVSDAVFTAAAVADILLAGTGAFGGIPTIIIFILIGTLGLWIPIFVSIVSPQKSEARLASMRKWLVANTQMILVIEFAILGIFELLKGLFGLIA
jgi:hypothetical protein